MKFFHDSAFFLLRLMLLAELFVQSSSRPTHSLCSKFGSMIHQVEKLMHLSRQLHDLTDEELWNFNAVEPKLDHLPNMQHTAAYFSSLKVNESLSQLYVYTESFRQHVNWLKTAQENVSVASPAADSSIMHLQHLSRLTKNSLNLINEEVPQLASPSFPDISVAFDALRFSVEISERLQAFCSWSKRVLLHLQRGLHCPKH